MTKKRRLSDLFVVGTEVSIEDPNNEGDPIVVWIQKLSPVQHEAALRKANEKRAPYLALKHLELGHPDLEVYEAELDTQMANLSEVELLTAKKEGAIRAAKEDEVAAEDEWSEDNYLQSLLDSWSEELMAVYAKDSENEEAGRVKGEIERFQEQVEKKLEGELRHIRREYEEMDPHVRRKESLGQVLTYNADIRWMSEYRRQELFYSVRVSEENSRELYFESVDEVAELAAPVYNILLQAYQGLTVNPLEGKD